MPHHSNVRSVYVNQRMFRASGLNADAAPATTDVPARISIEELRDLWERGDPVSIVDVRRERAFANDRRRAHGSVRLDPGDPVRGAERLGLPRDATIALYCA